MVGCAANGNGSGGGGTPAPTATLSVTPTAIIVGQNVTLAWGSTNADQGTVDSGVGVVGLNGSTQLQPTTTTTYTYTATGPGGTATATATVTVNVITSFDGLKQSDGVVQSDGSSNDDVDANGAIGTHQYLEYINTSFQAYDKTTGAPVWASALPIAALWPAGSPCSAVGANGQPAIQLDAHVIFDRLASRWVIAAKTSNPNPPQGYTFCLAVSNTDDLTKPLVWTTYSTPAGFLNGLLGQNSKDHTYFPDWPKISTWNEASGKQSAYYAAIDLQDTDNFNTEEGSLVCAFDRASMLAGTTPKTPACLNLVNDPSLNVSGLFSSGVFVAHSLIPADIDGTTVPPSGRDEFMVSIQNPDLTAAPPVTTSSTLNLWDFHLDWTAATPLSVTLSSITLPTPFTPGCYLYDPTNPAITNCVYEPPAASGQSQQIVDSVGDRLMPRLAYRNFGSYESYLVSQTVQTGPGANQGSPNPYQTGVQWYELRDNGTGTPALHQSGTINPDGVLYRFLPSIAQDKTGNVAVGYSTSNVFTDPGIYFSYWNLSSTAAPTEILIYQGAGEEVTPSAPAGRWGSYSSMTVDPSAGDDCTFWYVNEYFAADDTWVTRIANFKIPGCQ